MSNLENLDRLESLVSDLEKVGSSQEGEEALESVRMDICSTFDK